MSDTVGMQIKKRRKELSISQLKLAEMCGYKTKGSVSRIEKGETDLTQDQVILFAKALKTSPSYIMGWVDDPNYSMSEKSKTTPMAINIGQQLTNLEKEHGYSEDYVAKEVDISVDYYRNLKDGVNHIFDTDLMLKFSKFYKKRWTDFFPPGIKALPPNDNVVALQYMSGRSDEEVCKALNISIDEYNLIRLGEKQLDYVLLEKFSSFYNISFSTLLGTNLMQYADDKQKRLSVKMQAYLNDIFAALNGEEFDKDDMQELIDYIRFMAKNKKVKRMKEGK